MFFRKKKQNLSAFFVSLSGYLSRSGTLAFGFSTIGSDQGSPRATFLPVIVSCCSYIFSILPSAADVCLLRACVLLFPPGRFPPPDSVENRPLFFISPPGCVVSQTFTCSSPWGRQERFRNVYTGEAFENSVGTVCARLPPGACLDIVFFMWEWG